MSLDEFDGEDELTRQCQRRVGHVLGGKWTLQALIGIGGMAAVYASTHRNGATSAIKILHPQVAGNDEAKSRFLREAYIANKVGHPGTVAVLDDDVDAAGNAYLVMELLVGESIDARASRAGGTLPPREVLAIADRTLAVLEVAHEKEIVHRDLKPENLFLTKAGVLKVLDFGIARLRESSLSRTKTGMLMGTPAFMAPEQAMARWADVDGRTDLWAVGATMFTLLTGLFVHEGETNNEMLVYAATQPARSLARAAPEAPLALVRFVDRALEYDKIRRFADAASMRAEIAGLAAALGGSAVASPAAGQATRSPEGPTAAYWGQGEAGPRDAAAERGGDSKEARASRATAVGGVPEGRPAAAPTPGTKGDAGRIASSAGPERTATARRPVSAALRQELSSPDTTSTEADCARMRDLFSNIEKALVAKTQYGAGHPEAVRRFERALQLTIEAIAECEGGLAWSVNPYSFHAGKETLWEPEPPLNRVPYQLFSDGIRALALTPGLTEGEFKELLRIVTIDPATELAPEDDLVTLLWDASLEHVLYFAIDSFAEGDQEARARFERERQGIVALAHFDTSEALAASWASRVPDPNEASAAKRQRGVLELLAARHSETDTEAVARADRLRVPDAPPLGAEVLRIDPAVLDVLAARIAPDTTRIGERFVLVAAGAFTDAELRGDSAPVTAPLRAAVDGLARTGPDAAVDFVCALCRAVELPRKPPETERLRAALAGALVSKDTMRALLTGAGRASTEKQAEQARFTEALGLILGYLDGSHVPIVLEVVGAIADAELRTMLLEYVQRAGVGHERLMGSILPTADVELGVAIVRILAALGTPASREAIAQGAQSPHPVVRIEALGHVEGVSSERLRVELRSLLEDREPSVRLAALVAMAQYGIRVAGPFLVLRIRGRGFDGLPIGERNQALETLCTLAPNRAEAVAIELLGEGGFFSSEAHEQTRELAADLLGRVGSGPDALAALGEAAKKRFRGNEQVRAAASRSLDQVTERASKRTGASRP